MNKVVIADAGPLIVLARIHQLSLLPRIFSKVWVTDEVIVECTVRTDFPEGVHILEALRCEQLERCATPVLSHFTPDIDAGEASAIAAALECGCGVLMDDRAGRRMAIRLEVPVIGTLGMLMLAKRKGFIPVLKPILELLVASGYFLGNTVISNALRDVGE